MSCIMVPPPGSHARNCLADWSCRPYHAHAADERMGQDQGQAGRPGRLQSPDALGVKSRRPAFAFHPLAAAADLESVKLPGIKETAEEAASSPGGAPWGQGSSYEQPTRNSQGLVMGAVAHPPSLMPSGAGQH